MKLTAGLKAWVRSRKSLAPSFDDADVFKKEVGVALADGSMSADDFARLSREDGPTPDAVFGAAKHGSPGGRPSTERSPARHVRSGEAVRDELGRDLYLPGEADFGFAGAFLKSTARRAGLDVVMSSEENDRLALLYKGQWAGKVGNQFGSVPGAQAKAVLEDSLSGGTNIVPTAFDSSIVVYPLIYGELAPYVDMRQMPIGSSVEGAAIESPTATWGVGDGTDMPLLDTANLISPIAASVHPLTVAIEVGRDLLADSPAAIGAALVEAIGLKFAAEVDRVVAVGNATSEPEGIFMASGVTSMNAENGAGGPPTLADYEELLFSVGKQYRTSAWRPAFLTNDVSYSRVRGLAVSETDQRRVLGLNHSSYSTLEFPHKIQGDIPNGSAAFGALRAYRLWRRQGMTIEWVTQGKELALRNIALLVVRARYGGKLTDPAAFVKWTDGQS